MSKKVVGSVPGSVLGMLADLNLKLRDGSITLEELDKFTKRQNPFVTISDQFLSWKSFYSDIFGITLTLLDSKMPKTKAGFGRSIIIVRGLTINQIYKECVKLFPCWRYTDDLDTATKGLNDREPTEDYGIWIRDRVEADEDLNHISANDLKRKKIGGITLLERLILELRYFSDTGKHLDIQSVTLCSGSRYCDDGVPSVYWYGDKLRVGWYLPSDAGSSLRSRAVVS